MLAIHEIPLPETKGDFRLPVVLRAPLFAAELPVLHSNPTATAKLFLDFNGRTVPTWGVSSPVVPPFDYVDDLDTVTAIWQRVAKDYAAFNVDVTTEDPGNETNRVTAVIAIGGSWQDWYGQASGGVAFVGGFTNFAPNVGFVFARSLGNDRKYIADAASHEAGHLFGLTHQAEWANGVLAREYRTDGAIMGAPYSNPNPFWVAGQTVTGAPQDDAAYLAGLLGTNAPPPPPDDSMTATEKAALLSSVASLRSVADTLAAMAGTTTPGTASPDGTRITAPNGTITTADGIVWSFGGPMNGGYAILQNGKPPFVGGASTELGIKGGVIYAFNSYHNWFRWTGTAWQVLNFDPFAQN